MNSSAHHQYISLFNHIPYLTTNPSTLHVSCFTMHQRTYCPYYYALFMVCPSTWNDSSRCTSFILRTLKACSIDVEKFLFWGWAHVWQDLLEKCCINVVNEWMYYFWVDSLPCILIFSFHTDQSCIASQLHYTVNSNKSFVICLI